MPDRYLYGASVQGIQGFIFQTNKLREIVGASELIEQTCTELFYESAGIEKSDPNIILSAAGNIRYLFDSEEKCRSFVRHFPKKVMDSAPGITVSQAVIPMENVKLNHAIKELEIKLKEQRNKPSIPFERGFMGLERSRRTGGIAYSIIEKRKGGTEFICEATSRKLNTSNSKSLFQKVSGEQIADRYLALDIEDITNSGSNSWIAVVHADGNALGSILQNLGRSFENRSDDEIKTAFRLFSTNLDESTRSASQLAYQAIKKHFDPDFKLPIRPIVLGGDDLTIILRADLALEFTTTFLLAFEAETEKRLAFLSEYGVTGIEKGISACAGIAYVKESYPFHYAVSLSEKLCRNAKRFVKQTVGFEGQVPLSALSFFKVQDSFIESEWEDIHRRTMMAGAVDLNYGPYLIHDKENWPSINHLNNRLNILREEAVQNSNGKGVSKLRRWISELYKDKSTADFMLDRMKEVNGNLYKKLDLDNERQNRTIIYDLIQLHSLTQS